MKFQIREFSSGRKEVSLVKESSEKWKDRLTLFLSLFLSIVLWLLIDNGFLHLLLVIVMIYSVIRFFSYGILDMKKIYIDIQKPSIIIPSSFVNEVLITPEKRILMYTVDEKYWKMYKPIDAGIQKKDERSSSSSELFDLLIILFTFTIGFVIETILFLFRTFLQYIRGDAKYFVVSLVSENEHVTLLYCRGYKYLDFNELATFFENTLKIKVDYQKETIRSSFTRFVSYLFSTMEPIEITIEL